MDSEFEFLRRFEGELSARAKADARREASPKPTYPRRWKPWVAAAAALLVLAAGIGFLANSNFTGSQASMAAVGSAPRPQAPHSQAFLGIDPQAGAARRNRGSPPTTQPARSQTRTPRPRRPPDSSKRSRVRRRTSRPAIFRRSSATDRSRSRSTTARSRRRPARSRTSPQ